MQRSVHAFLLVLAMTSHSSARGAAPRAADRGAHRWAATPAAPAAAGSSAARPPAGREDFRKECADLIAAKGRLEERERLHRLFDVAWRYQMRESPEFATVVGYPGQNARWTDLSLEAIERRHHDLAEPLAVIKSIDRARLEAADQLNYDLFRKGIEDAIEGTRFKSEYVPVTQLGGVQQMSAQVLAMMPDGKVADYEDMIARLNALPAAVDQTVVLLKKGIDAGITPPKITLRDVPDQVKNQILDEPMQSPLLQHFARMPDSIPRDEQERLKNAAARAYRERVRPAFERLRAFLLDTYLPHARESIGMSELPDGAAWYAYNVRQQTTTDLTPQKIHEMGLSEVKRIRPEMDAVIAQVKFRGSFAEFAEFLRTDPQFFFTDSRMLVMAYRDIAKRTDPGLVKLFRRLPRLPYGVIPVPSYMEKSQTTAYYEPGSLEGSRPGEYFVNTYDLKSRPRWEMEALSLHESVPGHHLQIALAQEMEDLPDFRRYGGYTAFVEGWALYAESLGPELGMYEDPYSKFGQLTYEIWRAIRLVVDTGIHSMGWTRQQAIDYFRENSPKAQHDIEVEVDRYIVDPGQALAYKLGELKIKELREYASRELGERFDLRAFHDEVLSQGGLPLGILDARMRAWVAAQKSAARSLSG